MTNQFEIYIISTPPNPNLNPNPNLTITIAVARQNQWKAPPLHALRVVGSMVANNLNLRLCPSHPAYTFLLLYTSDIELI